MTPLVAGGIPPFGADFNGILNAVTQAVRWACAGGQYPYDAAFSTAVSGYPLGAIVQRADGTGEWLNLTDGNTTNPETGGAGWAPMDNYGITAITGLTNANVTLTALQYGRNVITLAGTLTGNVQIIFPTTLQQWTVVNNCTGAFVVTCKTASGTGSSVPNSGGIQLFWGDGTNLNQSAGDSRYTPALQANAINIVTVTGSLAASVAGGTVVVNAAGATTQTLPAASAVTAGKRIEFLNINAGSATVSRAGADVITTNSTTSTSLVVGNGDTLTLESNGTNGWYAVSGSAQLKFSNSFSGLLSPNGWTRQPNGMILQWGQATGVAGGAAALVTFPVVFPTTFCSGNATISQVPTTTPAGAGIYAAGLSSMGVTNYGTGAATAIYWDAKGY